MTGLQVTAQLPFEKHTKMLLDMKRYREAGMVVAKWVESRPDDGNAWFFKAFAETNAHQPNAALASINRALELKPDNAMILAQKAQILAIVGHSQQCLDILDELLRRKDLHPGLRHQIGTTLNNIGEHERAVTLFEQVRQVEPQNATNLVSLGTAYHILGRSEEAAQAQLEALELKPDNFRAYWLLGQMQPARPESNRVEFFSRVLAERKESLQARICLNFALAKQYEELQDFNATFTHLQAGSTAVLEHTPYSEEREQEVHDAIVRSFSEQFCQQQRRGCDSTEVIFIVGMPRTGTTLLEQIITTYPGIETAGELHHFPHMLNQACLHLTPNAPPRDMFSKAAQLDWNALGESYLAAARLHCRDSERLIDKYPLNFNMIGPILQALPNARIIHLQRNPMDTCFSNYKLLYRLGTALHTYDLHSLGEYYCAYRQMMEHWHRCYPGKILNVSYEALVTDAEQETRRVTDYLGLEWRPQCLEFYKAGGAVATASTTQVRKPINTGSLYKWRKFESQLRPLLAFFEGRNIGVDGDY